MLVERAVAVVQPEVLLGVVARAELAGERRWRQPDQIDSTVADRGRVLAHDLIPPLAAESRELLRMSVAVRLPVKALQHDAIVIEPRLGRGGRNTR